MGQPQADVDLRRKVTDSMAMLLVRMLRLDQPVTENMRLMDEIGLSSSAGLELLLELEDELEIEIDVEQLDEDEMQTVGDLAGYVASHSRPR